MHAFDNHVVRQHNIPQQGRVIGQTPRRRVRRNGL